jgi:lysine/ornithine N-monooxygenase
MSELKKEDVFNEFDELIQSFSEEDKKDFADKVRSIKEKVRKLLNQEEDYLYHGIVNKSLEEVWDNEKDDAYNDL